MKTTTRICLGLLAGVAGAVDDASAWKPLLDRELSHFDVYLSYPGDRILDVLQGKVSPEAAAAD